MIKTCFMSQFYNNSLANHWVVERIFELIVRKYYWPILYYNIEKYIQGYKVCLICKLVK